MKCPKCDHENPSSAKFCRNCGAKLPSVCPECGRQVNPEDRFCMECGARLLESEPTKTGIAMPRLEDMHSQLQSLIPEELAQKYATAEPQAAGENRPITALFADISGFTPMSATQPSETMLQLVQDCFRQLVGIVARYEGIISGFRGDGLLALFGAPILHENDAERAIRAAMDMRDAMHDRQLEVTIGINTAPMTVGEIQTQLHREYTAYGTDVILASRLQDAAEPGQILAGTGTHRLTRRIFDFGVVHDLELQGFAQPVTAYSIQQVKVHPEKLRGIEGLRSRMIGREHEFAELKEAADLWLQGQGQMVCIVGEAGIGKSRLVAELRQYLETRQPSPPLPRSPALCLEGRCVSIGQPISYWPFIDILRTYFGFREEDDTPAIARKVTESITSLTPQGAEETLPLLGNLLSIKYGNELDDRLKFASPEQIRHQTLMRLRDIFETLARQQPLMLILEDLHWADDLSLDLVSLLMDELANSPIMLLCVYRPEKELVHQERTIPELEYAFKHAFTQEATYEGILERSRREFHHLVASGIERLYQEHLEEYYEELAHHYSRSGNAEKTVEYLLKAGGKARNSYANESAISYFQQALDMLKQHGLKRDDWHLEALCGLGEVYLLIHDFAAEDVYKEAIQLAGDMKFSPRQLAKLYAQLSSALKNQGRHSEAISYAEMGLDILGDDTRCMEGAMIYGAIAVAYAYQGNDAKYWEYTQKHMPFIRELPYSRELLGCYVHIIQNGLRHIGLDATWQWAEELEERAERNHDLQALAWAYYEKTDILSLKGDHKNMLILAHKELDIANRTGEIRQIWVSYTCIMYTLLIMGMIEETKPYAQELMDHISEYTGFPGHIEFCYRWLGNFEMAQRHWEQAIQYYQNSVARAKAQSSEKPTAVIYPLLCLGKAFLKNGDHQLSINSLQDTIHRILNRALTAPDHTIGKVFVLQNLSQALNGMEEAHMALGTPEKFVAFCQHLRKQYGEAMEVLSIGSSFLKPAQLSKGFSHSIFADDFGAELIDPAWNWLDEFGDCVYIVVESGGLEICAANGRDLRYRNLGAPRLMRDISGDLATEVHISPASQEKPQMGGLLVWRDIDNFLRFERGVDGKHEMRLHGYVDGKWQIAGRGLLRAEDNEEVHLRLERSGDEFTSYCSTDGKNWFTCGKMILPMEDPIQVGIHAIGMIDRTIYCGEYREGTATVFRNFRIWTRE